MKTPIYTTTAVANGADKTLTVESLLKSIEVLKNIPEDPLKVWMKEKGYDPDNGAQLVLPPSYGTMVEGRGALTPGYIRFSKFVRVPTLVHNPMEII